MTDASTALVEITSVVSLLTHRVLTVKVCSFTSTVVGLCCNLSSILGFLESSSIIYWSMQHVRLEHFMTVYEEVKNKMALRGSHAQTARTA